MMPMPFRMFARENDDVYRALVADLALTLVPTTIMGLTLIGVDLVVWWTTGNAAFLAAAIIGGGASIAKIGLMLRQKRRQGQGMVDLRETVRWENCHTLVTTCVALSIGFSCAAGFLDSDLHTHMLMTAMLFGYCSGVVSRTGIRPRIACIALVLASVPTILIAAQNHDAGHKILAAIFGIFMLGAMETVRHVHQTAMMHISMQLDMAALARHDVLTGLSNRLGLQEASRREAKRGGKIAVYYIDLNGFKNVNDRFGHAGGDTVLVTVAERLQAVVPPQAIVARVGGDEFVVLQGNVNGPDEATVLAQNIEAALCDPYPVGSSVVSISGSAGYVVAEATLPFDDLLRAADEASYRLKERASPRV